MMDLARISSLTSGKHLGDNVMVSGLVNDTRKECGHKLYVAIKGPNFDGHQYVDAAKENGAVAALIEKNVHVTVPCVQVDNSVLAMASIASAWRRDFDIPILGITGSAGKTTLKELAGSVLSQSRVGLITEGNLNNEIGVPLTLTRLGDMHEFAVIEMGMNHAGEIQRLSKMTAPTVAIINNAAPAHLDDLGSIEAVAQAKGEIIEGLDDNGVIVLNADDDFFDLWQRMAGSKEVVSFGLTDTADVFASYTSTVNGSTMAVKGRFGEFIVELPIQGEHNVRNALAVIAATMHMGCSIKDVQQGLKQYQPLANRGGVHCFDNFLLIDDTYNANPVSMQAAFDVLKIKAAQASQDAKSVHVSVVLGDMSELGDQVIRLHEQVGIEAALVADSFYCCGKNQQYYLQGVGKIETLNNEMKLGSKVALGFSDTGDLIEKLKQRLLLQDENIFNLVLVKGSRSAGMEKVVKKLIQYVSSGVSQQPIDETEGS